MQQYISSLYNQGLFGFKQYWSHLSLEMQYNDMLVYSKKFANHMHSSQLEKTTRIKNLYLFYTI